MAQVYELGQKLIEHLYRYAPDFSSAFLPGVSREFVQSFLEVDLSTLPDDFYELYAWHNGSQEYFRQPITAAQICDFSPIETINEDRLYSWDESDPPTYKNRSLLPFITKEPNFFAVVLGRNYVKDAHIVEVDEGGAVVLHYDSITTMLQSTVECFEANAFYLNNEGFLSENSAVLAEILRIKNPKTVIEALIDLEAGLPFYGWDDSSDEYIYSLRLESLFSSLETLRVLRSSEAVVSVTDSLTRLQEKNSRRALAAQSFLQRWLRTVSSP